MGIGERGLRHAAKRLARTWGLPVLLVSGNVEQDKENEVRTEDTDTSEGGELLSGAFTSAGHPGVVTGREVSVRGEVDEAWAVLLVIMSDFAVLEGLNLNVPRSMMNWMIWRRVTHSFHQILTPRALWK